MKASKLFYGFQNQNDYEKYGYLKIITDFRDKFRDEGDVSNYAEYLEIPNYITIVNHAFFALTNTFYFFSVDMNGQLH